MGLGCSPWNFRNPEARRSVCFWRPVKKDIRFVPTPTAVVEGMLALAGVGVGDTVFDLGCGDGRLVIAAALLGSHGVGIDIDTSLVERSRLRAAQAGVESTTEFRVGNFFDADLTGATVVVLYLLHAVNRVLLPKLRQELRPGTRIVSHSFDMGDWPAQQMMCVENKFLYLWTLP